MFHVPVDYTSSRRNFCIRSFFSRRLACACFWHGNIGVLDWLDYACPMGLEPYLLATVSAHGDFERVEKEDIMSCIECGSCQFTCPSNRPMLDYIRLGKGKVGAMIRARQVKK